MRKVNVIFFLGDHEDAAAPPPLLRNGVVHGDAAALHSLGRVHRGAPPDLPLHAFTGNAVAEVPMRPLSLGKSCSEMAKGKKDFSE